MQANKQLVRIARHTKVLSVFNESLPFCGIFMYTFIEFKMLIWKMSEILRSEGRTQLHKQQEE